jgi:hypothetical protein
VVDPKLCGNLSPGGGRHHFFAAISLSMALSSIASGQNADPVLAAHIGRLRSGFLLPMICSSVKRLGFMSIAPAGDGLYPFWSRSRGSGQGPNDAIRDGGAT